MNSLGLLRLGVAAGVAYTSGGCFYPILRFPRTLRALGLIAFEALILLSPIAIPSAMPFRRLMASVLAIRIALSVYDLYTLASAGLGPSPAVFFISLMHPFVLVWRRVVSELKPPFAVDLFKFLANSILGSLVAALLVGMFFVPWDRYPLVLEYCCKVIGSFVMIQFLPNALAALCRLAGLPATDFAGNFFLARNPAEFWRRYNRPTMQFLHEYVFKPANGRRHPIRATLLVFLVSGVLHEYVFDIAVPAVVGFQLAFFLLQGVAVVLTGRLHPTGWRAVAGVLGTLTFNLLSGALFFHCLNAAVPFFVARG